MAKKVRKIDQKLERIIAVVIESAAEIVEAAEDAQRFVKEIDDETMAINEELQHERVTSEDAGQLYQTKISPLHGRLENRMLKMLKNNKAISNLLLANKALYEEAEDQG